MAEVEDGTAPATAGRMQRLRLRQEASEDDAGTDTMAEADDGTAPATEDDAAASADVEASEDDAGADTMAEVEEGTVPAVRRGR